MKETFGIRLQAFKGIGPGFDFLRVALAITIVINHCFLIFDGNYDYVGTHGLWAVFGLTVPIFFSLSGFLISASAQRLKLKDFLLNRAIRIVPALAVDIFVSALLIGPIVTTVGLHAYYSAKDFRHYFLNIIGFIHYLLPGVFLDNPFPGQVNGSLWTVPFEIGCYALMTILIATGAIRSKGKLIAAVLIFCVAYFMLSVFSSNPSNTDSGLANYAYNFIGDRGRGLYFYFLGGALVYCFRDHILYSFPIFVVCAILALSRLFFADLLGSFSDVVLAIPVSYLTAYIGLQLIRRLPLYSKGDYSYGIYLYAYPLQQLLVQWVSHSFLAFCLGSVVLATAVAMLSWHLIEKPLLQVRRKFSFTAHKGDAGQLVQNGAKPLIS